MRKVEILFYSVFMELRFRNGTAKAVGAFVCFYSVPFGKSIAFQFLIAENSDEFSKLLFCCISMLIKMDIN